MNYNPVPSYYPTYQYPMSQPVQGYAPQVQPVAPAPIPQVATPASPQSQSNIYWVQGSAGANAYTVAPNNTVILMDSENPVVYKKSADENGKPLPLVIYDLIKRESPTNTSTPLSNNMDEYVKKEDLKSYIADLIDKEMDKRMSQMSFKPATKKRRADEEDEE